MPSGGARPGAGRKPNESKVGSRPTTFYFSKEVYDALNAYKRSGRGTKVDLVEKALRGCPELFPKETKRKT